MSSSQRPQAATKSRLARLRHACGATQESRRRDEYVSDDLGWIRHAWSATRVQTASCCPCAHDQLSTRSVWFFPSRISAGWLCPLPHVRHPFGAMRSYLVQLKEIKGSRSPRLVTLAVHDARVKLRRATGPKVTLHLVPFFPLWHDGLRHGRGTSLLCNRCSSLFSTET